MELSFNINYICNQLIRQGVSEPKKKTCELFSNAGFHYADCSPAYLTEDWEKDTKEWMEATREFGIKIHQTHSPYNRYRQLPLETHKVQIERCMEAASMMGASTIAVHADEYDFAKYPVFDKEIAYRYNQELFSPFLQKAERNRIYLCFETVFEEGCFPNAGKETRYTSNAEDLEHFIRSMNSPFAKCCWDFGHAKISFEDTASVIEKMGDLIVATHTHDNYKQKDLHLLPFLGDTDWKREMGAMKKIGYSGILTFEIVYGLLPDIEYVTHFLNLAYQSGKRLTNMLEG